MIKKVAHLGLIVKDVEKSSRFYQQFCGCEPVRLLENKLVKIQFLTVAGVTIELLQHMGTDPAEHRCAGIVDHVAFEVDDIEAALEKVRAAGVRILEGPRLSIIGAKIAFFEGPDRERVEFIQPTLLKISGTINSSSIWIESMEEPATTT